MHWRRRSTPERDDCGRVMHLTSIKGSLAFRVRRYSFGEK